jgi:DNA-binding transcriptional MerR regulator
MNSKLNNACVNRVCKTRYYNRVTFRYVCGVKHNNILFSNDWFDENFFEGFVGSDSYSQIKHYLNKKTHKIDESQISSRVLNHWYEKGIIIDDRPDNKGWKKFSFSDAAWVTIVIKLRKFGLSLDKIKHVKEQLDYFNKIDKVSKCSLLDFYLMIAMNSGIPIKLVVFESGQAEMLRQIDLDLANFWSCIREDFISIDINKIVGKMLNKQGVAADYLGYNDVPKPKIMQEIEDSINADDVKTVSIKINTNEYILNEELFVKDKAKAQAIINLISYGSYHEVKQSGKSNYRVTKQKKIKRETP